MKAIAEALARAGVPTSDLRFVGSRRGQDRALLAGDVALIVLPGRGLRRSLAPRAIAQNLGAVLGLAVAQAMSLVLVARWRPRCVVSVGGYASLTTTMAAVLLRRPLVLVELDAYASASQRVVQRFARVRCVPFASTDAGVVVTGVPVRHEIAAIDRSPLARRAAKAHMSPPIDDARHVVVVMTGSLGAGSVNRTVSALATAWRDRDDICLLHVTGRRDFEAVSAAAPTGGSLDYRIIDFADMTTLWGVADVAVTRAGATTVAELTALGLVAVLVPLPGAPGDHQTKNATVLGVADAALVLADAALNVSTLANALNEILDEQRRARMAQNAKALARGDAATRIADVVMSLEGPRV